MNLEEILSTLDVEIDKNRKKAYDRLGIDEDFEYTKLY